MTADAASTRRRRRWPRVLAWGLPIVLLVSLAGGAVYWRARQSWFVGTENGVVVVYRGVPDGLLGISPTVDQRSNLSTDELTEAQRLAVETGHEVSSRVAAIAYVDRLADDALARQLSTTTTTTSTTTTTTTTTLAPATPPPAGP